MGASAKITVTGIKEVARAFRQLGPRLATRVVKQAERKALKVPYAAARSAWPVKTGRAKKSIKIKSWRGPRVFKSSISLVLMVGGTGRKGDKAKGIVKPWWAFLNEEGFHSGGKRIRRGKKTIGYRPLKGQHVVRHEGKHIMKRTLKSTESMIKEIMVAEIVKGVDAVARG